MKAHHLGVLIAAAVLAVVAAMWASNLREADFVSEAGTPLIPKLAEDVNAVTELKLIGPGNVTIATLTRGEETWHLAEKYGHRANVARVRELLLKLSRAKLLEEKTSNPEYYPRLGVESIDTDNAGGVLIELDGIEVPSVIIGNAEPARDAVYARRADEPASWLASGSIVIADDLLDWLGRNVIDINASRIAEVEVTHPDGEVVLISKAAFGQSNYDVANIPDGRELERASIANAMAGVITDLNVNDVLPLKGSGFDELPTTRTTYRAFDGYVVHADLATKDDKYYVHFSASTDAAIATRYLPVTDTPDAEPQTDNVAGPVMETSQQSEADLSEVSKEAEEQNKLFSGWLYTLPKHKYDQMTRRLEDLLKDST